MRHRGALQQAGCRGLGMLRRADEGQGSESPARLGLAALREVISPRPNSDVSRETSHLSRRGPRTGKTMQPSKADLILHDGTILGHPASDSVALTAGEIVAHARFGDLSH